MKLNKSSIIYQTVVVLFVVLTSSFVFHASPLYKDFVNGIRVKHSTTSDELFLNVNNGIVYYKEEPYTGVAVDYYSNGEKSKSTTYVQGKKHGVFEKWFSNGRMSYRCEYFKGKISGAAYTWWFNGELRSKANFENGIPHGEQMQWYRSGNKFKKINLNFGNEHGVQQSWRENGKLYNNYHAIKGRIFGLKRANLCFKLNNEDII